MTAPALETRRRDERAVAAVVLLAAAAGWFALLRPPAAAATPAGAVDALVAICTLRPDAAGGTAAVLAGWTVMVVAMMLPPAIPLLQTVVRLVRSRADRVALVAMAAVVFVALWAVVGVIFVAGDTAAAALSGMAPWLTAHERALAGAVVIGAGLFQFTPLKTACLRACRTPRGFAMRHWRNQRPALIEIGRMSAAYAASCVGCCWALMAVCFVAGTSAMAVMVVLSAVMAAERMTRWGRRLVAPVGVAAIVLGLALVAVDLSTVPAAPTALLTR